MLALPAAATAGFEAAAAAGEVAAAAVEAVVEAAAAAVSGVVNPLPIRSYIESVT